MKTERLERRDTHNFPDAYGKWRCSRSLDQSPIAFVHVRCLRSLSVPPPSARRLRWKERSPDQPCPLFQPCRLDTALEIKLACQLRRVAGSVKPGILSAKEKTMGLPERPKTVPSDPLRRPRETHDGPTGPEDGPLGRLGPVGPTACWVANNTFQFYAVEARTYTCR